MNRWSPQCARRDRRPTVNVFLDEPKRGHAVAQPHRLEGVRDEAGRPEVLRHNGRRGVIRTNQCGIVRQWRDLDSWRARKIDINSRVDVAQLQAVIANPSKGYPRQQLRWSARERVEIKTRWRRINLDSLGLSLIHI